MYYPAQFSEDPGGGFVVTFRDIPEAITQGDDYQQAKDMAVDALVTVMDFYFEDRRPVPVPSDPLPGDVLIELPASIEAKVALLNEVVRARISNAELARKSGVPRQEMQRILDIGHSTKIDTSSRALAALGKKLEIKIVDINNHAEA